MRVGVAVEVREGAGEEEITTVGVGEREVEGETVRVTVMVEEMEGEKVAEEEKETLGESLGEGVADLDHQEGVEEVDREKVPEGLRLEVPVNKAVANPWEVVHVPLRVMVLVQAREELTDTELVREVEVEGVREVEAV